MIEILLAIIAAATVAIAWKVYAFEPPEPDDRELIRSLSEVRRSIQDMPEATQPGSLLTLKDGTTINLNMLRDWKRMDTLQLGAQRYDLDEEEQARLKAWREREQI